MEAFRIIMVLILQPFPSDEIPSDESIGQCGQICCMVIGDSHDLHSETGCFVNKCPCVDQEWGYGRFNSLWLMQGS